MLNSTATSTSNALDIWDKIEILIERDGEKGLYITRVEDIGSGKIVASYPEFVEGNSLLTDNSDVYVQFRRPDAMYRFPAKIVLARGRGGDKVELHQSGKVNRVQRREFVRIDMKLDIKFYRLKIATERDCLQEPNWRESFSKNVSAGGMLMWVGDEVEKGDILMLKIGDYYSINMPRMLSAFCCRTITINDRQFAGVEFIRRERLPEHFTPDELAELPSGIAKYDTQMQNKMVRFVFEQQLKERQKGLI